MSSIHQINFKEKTETWYAVFADAVRNKSLALEEVAPHLHRAVTYANRTKDYETVNFLVETWLFSLEKTVKPHIREACFAGNTTALSIWLQGLRGRGLDENFIVSLFVTLSTRNHVECIRLLSERLDKKVLVRRVKKLILVRVAREAAPETYLLLIDLFFPEPTFELPSSAREKIVLCGNMELLEALLKKNKTLISEHARFMTLAWACKLGHCAAVECLLKFVKYPQALTYEILCEPVDDKSKYPAEQEFAHHTLLGISVAKRNIQLAQVLIRKGADPSHHYEKKARSMIKKQAQPEFFRLFFTNGCSLSQFVKTPPKCRTDRMAVAEYARVTGIFLVLLARKNTPECPFHESRIPQEIFVHIMSWAFPNLKLGHRERHELSPATSTVPLKKVKIESK